MAAFGTTGADFGNTRRSRELIARTRQDGGDEGPSDQGSGPTPAAAALLASLRSELLPLRPSASAAAKPRPTTVSSVRPAPQPRQSPRPVHADVDAARPPMPLSTFGGSAAPDGGGKRFLSKAERRKEKKRKGADGAGEPTAIELKKRKKAPPEGI